MVLGIAPLLMLCLYPTLQVPGEEAKIRQLIDSSHLLDQGWKASQIGLICSRVGLQLLIEQAGKVKIVSLALTNETEKRNELEDALVGRLSLV